MADKKRGYDPDLDERIAKFGMFKLTEERGIYVGAHSYDNSPIRVLIQRYEKTKKGTRFYNAGRLNGNELPLVIKGLKRAVAWYQEQGGSVEVDADAGQVAMAASKEKKKVRSGRKHPKSEE